MKTEMERTASPSRLMLPAASCSRLVILVLESAKNGRDRDSDNGDSACAPGIQVRAGDVMETPEILKSYIESWSNSDVDACIAPFGTGGTYCDPAVPKPTLALELKEHWAAFFSAFPDLKFETVGLYLISENTWAWRWIGRGTNTGSFAGAPPTGRKVELPGCEFIEVREGSIHSVAGYFDRLTILSELGLVPPQA